MAPCLVCDGTGWLLDMPCRFCDGEEAVLDPMHWSDEGLERLRLAPSPEARERIFRKLALRCHPDKFATDSDKAAATQAFQKLLTAREEAQDVSEPVPEESVDSEGRPPVGVMKQGDIVHGLACSPSGEIMASCGDSKRLCIGKAASGDWRFACLSERFELEEKTSDTALAVTFLSELQLAVAIGRCIKVWCLQDMANTWCVALDSRVLSLAADEGSLRLAAALENGTVQICDCCQQRGELDIDTKFDCPGPLSELVWAFGGKMIVVAVGSHVSLWQEFIGEWKLSALLVNDMDTSEVFCLDVVGSVGATGGASGKIAVWSLQGPSEDGMKSLSDGQDEFPVGNGSLSCVATHSAENRFAVNSVGLSPDGRFVASGGADCRVLLWCLYSKATVSVFYHCLPPGGCCLCTATVNAVRITPDGSNILAGGYDGLVTIWRMPQYKAVAV